MTIVSTNKFFILFNDEYLFKKNYDDIMFSVKSNQLLFSTKQIGDIYSKVRELAYDYFNRNGVVTDIKQFDYLEWKSDKGDKHDLSVFTISMLFKHINKIDNVEEFLTNLCQEIENLIIGNNEWKKFHLYEFADAFDEKRYLTFDSYNITNHSRIIRGEHYEYFIAFEDIEPMMINYYRFALKLKNVKSFIYENLFYDENESKIRQYDASRYGF